MRQQFWVAGVYQENEKQTTNDGGGAFGGLLLVRVTVCVIYYYVYLIYYGSERQGERRVAAVLQQQRGSGAASSSDHQLIDTSELSVCAAGRRDERAGDERLEGEGDQRPHQGAGSESAERAPQCGDRPSKIADQTRTDKEDKEKKWPS